MYMLTPRAGAMTCILLVHVDWFLIVASIKMFSFDLFIYIDKCIDMDIYWILKLLIFQRRSGERQSNVMQKGRLMNRKTAALNDA